MLKLLFGVYAIPLSIIINNCNDFGRKQNCIHCCFPVTQKTPKLIRNIILEIMVYTFATSVIYYLHEKLTMHFIKGPFC